MARRPGGKTERRKARQRRTQRPASTPPSVSAGPTATAEPEDTPAAEPARRITAPSAARAYTAGSSSLTDRERAEYHYVERDLRNIGILTAVLVALLIASYFVFSALGLVG
jgi:hypothetical protein